MFRKSFRLIIVAAIEILRTLLKTEDLLAEIVAGNPVDHPNKQLVSCDCRRRAPQGLHLGLAQFGEIVRVCLHHVEERTFDFVGENFAIGE
jgi:hypothetical protein